MLAILSLIRFCQLLLLCCSSWNLPRTDVVGQIETKERRKLILLSIEFFFIPIFFFFFAIGHVPICKQISDLRSYILICNWFIFHVLNRKTIANGQVPKPSPPPGGPTLSLFRHWLGSLQGGSSIAQRPSTDRGRMVAGENLSARFRASLEPACYALAFSPNRKVTYWNIVWSS